MKRQIFGSSYYGYDPYRIPSWPWPLTQSNPLYPPVYPFPPYAYHPPNFDPTYGMAFQPDAKQPSGKLQAEINSALETNNDASGSEEVNPKEKRATGKFGPSIAEF